MAVLPAERRGDEIVDESTDDAAAQVDATPCTQRQGQVGRDGAQHGAEDVQAQASERRRAAERLLADLCRTQRRALDAFAVGQRFIDEGQARARQEAFGRDVAVLAVGVLPDVDLGVIERAEADVAPFARQRGVSAPAVGDEARDAQSRARADDGDGRIFHGAIPHLPKRELLQVGGAAPVYFTLTGVHGDEMTFMQSVWFICRKVLPLLILPLFVALAVRKWTPRVHRLLLSMPRMTFYLWAVALTVVTGITVQFMLNQDNVDYQTEYGLLGVSLVLCVLQFILGRRIGRYYGDPVSSGQGLGQKNTILAIWMAQTYLHPLTAIAPSGYILWQNMINSWQLWKKGKKDK